MTIIDIFVSGDEPRKVIFKDDLGCDEACKEQNSSKEDFNQQRVDSEPVKYCVISYSNDLSNENMYTGVSVVFKTKHESKCQNELISKYHFSGNTSLYVFITENIWRTFDVIIEDQLLT